MSHVLTVKLSDAAHAVLELRAQAAAKSPAELATTALEQEFSNVGPTNEAELRAARERFERHFGSINLGYPTGADNASIDADLERAYADNHEGRKRGHATF